MPKGNPHPKPGPGRKPLSFYRKQVEQCLEEGAGGAAQYLKVVADGRELKPNAIRASVSQYLIDQACGRPTQKTVLAGDITIRIVEDGPEVKPQS